MNSFDIEFVLRQLRYDRDLLKLSRQQRGPEGWRVMFLEFLDSMRSNMSLYHEGYETDSWDKLIVIVKNWDGSEPELESHLRLIFK
jgi:hypothetical protein